MFFQACGLLNNLFSSCRKFMRGALNTDIFIWIFAFLNGQERNICLSQTFRMLTLSNVFCPLSPVPGAASAEMIGRRPPRLSPLPWRQPWRLDQSRLPHRSHAVLSHTVATFTTSVYWQFEIFENWRTDGRTDKRTNGWWIQSPLWVQNLKPF